jgi:hypothetical protein
VSYIAGSLVAVQGNFVDTADNLAIDPSTVTLKIKDGAGTTASYVYGDGDYITRQYQGTYTANIDTTPTDPTNTGIWTYEWVGSGEVGQSINSNTFVVVPAAL